MTASEWVAGRCERRHCGGILVGRMDALGRVVIRCEPCARNRAGLCRDCPNALPGGPAKRRGGLPRHMRCTACGRRHKQARNTAARRREYRNPVKRQRMLDRKRAAYQDPEVRARAHARNKAWRATHARPRDDGDRLYFREWAKRHRRERRVVAPA